MKLRLSKAAIQLREQLDDSFPDRDRASDGWVGDTRHAARKNMKNPLVLTAGAFLSAWAASNFALDYRAVLWAVLAGVFGYATPKK